MAHTQHAAARGGRWRDAQRARAGCFPACSISDQIPVPVGAQTTWFPRCRPPPPPVPQDRATLAHAYGKPIVMEEYGCCKQWDYQGKRSEIFRAFHKAADDFNFAGLIVWQVCGSGEWGGRPCLGLAEVSGELGLVAARARVRVGVGGWSGWVLLLIYTCGWVVGVGPASTMPGDGRSCRLRPQRRRDGRWQVRCPPTRPTPYAPALRTAPAAARAQVSAWKGLKRDFNYDFTYDDDGGWEIKQNAIRMNAKW